MEVQLEYANRQLAGKTPAAKNGHASSLPQLPVIQSVKKETTFGVNLGRQLYLQML